MLDPLRLLLLPHQPLPPITPSLPHSPLLKRNPPPSCLPTLPHGFQIQRLLTYELIIRQIDQLIQQLVVFAVIFLALEQEAYALWL